MLLNPIHNAIIGIRALVLALEALPSLVTGDPERDTVFGAEFLELGHDAGGDDGRGFGVQEVHEGLVELEFSVYGVGEEVGVDEDGVGWAEGGVGLEEEG